MSVAREQPHAAALATGHHPIPVVLDFVNPLRAGWRSLGGGWKARRYEASRKGTLQHAHLMRHDAGRVGSFGVLVDVACRAQEKPRREAEKAPCHPRWYV